jgi:hypothetical protein
MNGVHDMGGMHGMGPIQNQKDEPVYHEQDYRLSSLLSREMSSPMRDAGSKVGLFLDTGVRG